MKIDSKVKENVFLIHWIKIIFKLYLIGKKERI